LIVTLQLCNVVTIIMFCSHLLEQHWFLLWNIKFSSFASIVV
jgi:hypothetical protein